MNSVETFETAADEVIKILTKAKLVDGSTLQPEELKKSSKRVLFWYRRIETQDATKYPIKVIWSLGSLTPDGYADDVVARRNVIAYIDVYSKNGDLDSKTLTVLKDINKSFTKKGWKFEKTAYDSIDYIDGEYQLRYQATKSFKGGI